MANESFTIDHRDLRPSSVTQVLRGSSASFVDSMTISGGNFSSITLRNGFWTAIVGLDPGITTITITAEPGQVTEQLLFEIPSVPIEPFNNHNTFDDHGIFLGLPRNVGEKNLRYKRRLLDQFLHRSGIL